MKALQIRTEHKNGMPCVMVGSWDDRNIVDLLYRAYYKENNYRLKSAILKKNNVCVLGIMNVVYSADKKKVAKEIKAQNMFVCQKLGGRFYHRLRGASVSAWVQPHEEIIKKYCLRSLGYSYQWDSWQIRRVWKHIRIVKEVHEDGLYNIAPLVIYFGASPEKLKTRLGKGLWRRLVGRSLTTNKEIAVLLGIILSKSHIGSIRSFDKYKELLYSLARYKSSFISKFLLSKIVNSVEDFITINDKLDWVNNHAKVSSKHRTEACWNMLEDTLKMSDQLSWPISLDYSLKRMEKEHDTMAAELTIKIMKEDINAHKQFELTKRIPVEKNLKGVCATVLQTPFDVAHEGIKMHHCISSYIPEIQKRTYLVISLRKEDNNSTLGLMINGDHKAKIDQHSGTCNQPPTADLIEAADAFVLEYNNQMEMV